MALPRRAQMTLGALGMLLFFGILGLAWWWWRHRRDTSQPRAFVEFASRSWSRAWPSLRPGAVVRIDSAFQSPRACAPPGGPQPVRSGQFDPSLAAQEAATWPETGIGLLYSRAVGARVCLSPTVYYYVAVHSDNIAGARAMTVGDIVLVPGFNLSRDRLQGLVAHEARHRTQWAVGTVIGGPFAFPVAYAVVDFFFPGSRNFFERQADLGAGGYTSTGTGPVLGPAQWATLAVLAVIIVVALLGVRRRHASMRSPGRADTPGADTDRRMAEELTPDE